MIRNLLVRKVFNIIPRFTVKNHRPVQWAVSIIALSMLIALFTWLLLDESHWTVIYDRMAVTRDYNHLGELNRELQQENIKKKNFSSLRLLLASLYYLIRYIFLKWSDYSQHDDADEEYNRHFVKPSIPDMTVSITIIFEIK